MLYMVATIKNGKDIVGFRMLDTNLIKSGKCTTDINYDSVKSAIARGTKVENLGLKGDKLIGTNGVIDRYADIKTNNEIIEKSSIVVLFRTDDGFIVADYMGNVSKVGYDEALKLNGSVGIANAKIVERGGKKVVSSINGEYPFIEPVKIGNKKAEAKFIAVSDNDTMESAFEKVKMHIENPEKKLIGKLNKSNSDKLIKHVANSLKLVELIHSKNNARAAEVIKDISTKYMPVMSKICDKQAVIDNVKGLKAVYADLNDGDTSLIERAIQNMENDKVTMKSLASK